MIPYVFDLELFLLFFFLIALRLSCNPPCLLVSAINSIIALDYNNGSVFSVISNLSHAVALDVHYHFFFFVNGVENFEKKPPDRLYSR